MFPQHENDIWPPAGKERKRSITKNPKIGGLPLIPIQLEKNVNQVRRNIEVGQDFIPIVCYVFVWFRCINSFIGFKSSDNHFKRIVTFHICHENGMVHSIPLSLKHHIYKSSGGERVLTDSPSPWQNMSGSMVTRPSNNKIKLQLLGNWWCVLINLIAWWSLSINKDLASFKKVAICLPSLRGRGKQKLNQSWNPGIKTGDGLFTLRTH